MGLFDGKKLDRILQELQEIKMSNSFRTAGPLDLQAAVAAEQAQDTAAIAAIQALQALVASLQAGTVLTPDAVEALAQASQPPRPHYRQRFQRRLALRQPSNQLNSGSEGGCGRLQTRGRQTLNRAWCRPQISAWLLAIGRSYAPPFHP